MVGIPSVSPSFSPTKIAPTTGGNIGGGNQSTRNVGTISKGIQIPQYVWIAAAGLAAIIAFGVLRRG